MACFNSCFGHCFQIMAEFHCLTEVNLNNAISNSDAGKMLERIAEMKRPKKSPKWLEEQDKYGKAEH